MIQNFKKIVVGISGGVDSAVTALLLKRKGYDVQGVFMQNWDTTDEDGVCTTEKDYEDAQIVCRKLNVPLKRVNFIKQYWNYVFEEVIKDYQNGFTPNPDVLCNRHVKFNYFYKYAREVLEADAIATGHYARTNYGSYLENYNPNTDVQLLRAKDTFKDQTFFLCQIQQEALKRTMFPLGEYLKSEVKNIAQKNGLERVAEKKESMGICFIGDRNFSNFIAQYVEEKPGDFVDIDTGAVMGKHNGFHQWTIGQRSKLPGLKKAYYIAKKDTETNIIYVAMGTKHPLFHSSLFFTGKPHWISKQPTELDTANILKCQFKFQHTHDPVDCEVFGTGLGLIVLLFKHKRAITQGQFAVFYKAGECLGSARILHPGTSNFSLYWMDHHNKCKIKTRLHRYYESQLRTKI